jgi:hypothetical protein
VLLVRWVLNAEFSSTIWANVESARRAEGKRIVKGNGIEARMALGMAERLG